MSVNMFVTSAQRQADSVTARSQHDQQAYQAMIQALQQFVDEDRLDSAAYRNGKAFYNAVLIPMVKAGILLSEAVETACQKFVQTYQTNVDSGDLKSEELQERIHQLDYRISHLDAICSAMEDQDLPDHFKVSQRSQNRHTMELLINAKRVLQDKLEKLLTFHARSPEIFANIAELEKLVDQGADQAERAWTGNGFSIATESSWAKQVASKWQVRAENIKQKERQFHEEKIKTLEKYQIYAWPYEDPTTKEIKVMWFIDRNGVRIFDEALQNYVETYGKKLEGLYEVVGWEKIYELDLAARRKGDGTNYLTKHQTPAGWEWYSQAGAYVDSAHWYAQKSGLLDLALMAGLTYAGSKTKVATTTNVANVLDDLDDVAKKASGGNFGNAEKLEAHFSKHGGEFGRTFSNTNEYLAGANDVIKNGTKVQYNYKGELRTGYVKFMKNSSLTNANGVPIKSYAKFEFVGTNNLGEITTYHVESGKTFWKMMNNGKNIPVINPIE